MAEMWLFCVGDSCRLVLPRRMQQAPLSALERRRADSQQHPALTPVRFHQAALRNGLLCGYDQITQGGKNSLGYG